VYPAQNAYPSPFRFFARAPKKTITTLHKTSASLEDLPAELLELVAWYSLSPEFSLTSKKIYKKLGRMEVVRRDMVTFLFCEPVVHRDVSKLPFQSSIARSTSPVLTVRERDTLRAQYGEMDWCTPEVLKDQGDAVLYAWTSSLFTDEELAQADRLKLIRLQHGGTSPNIADSSMCSTDGRHSLYVRSTYKVKTVCAGGARDPCPHRNRDHCPKNPHRLGPYRLFALPNAPRRVLLAPNDDNKAAALQFYRRQAHHPKPGAILGPFDESQCSCSRKPRSGH